MKASSESGKFERNDIRSSKYLGITMEDNNPNEYMEKAPIIFPIHE